MKQLLADRMEKRGDHSKGPLEKEVSLGLEPRRQILKVFVFPFHPGQYAEESGIDS